jgi:hypothetical protein
VCHWYRYHRQVPSGEKLHLRTSARDQLQSQLPVDIVKRNLKKVATAGDSTGYGDGGLKEQT